MIRWTQREWREIATRLVARQVDPKEHGWRGALVLAMKDTLPADRWRDPSSLNSAKETLVPLMKEVLREPVQETLDSLRRTPEPPSAEKLSTEELLVELARRIAKIVDAGILLSAPQIVVNSPVDRGFHPKHDPSPKNDARQDCKRILVVGPQGQQQERLRQAFPDLKLTFVTCEQHPSACAAGNISLAIIWTKFTNHAQQDAVKALGYPLLYANSMLDIENILREV